MSFITYILLIGFHNAQTNLGNKGFDPDILGIKSTKNFFILLLYTIILKAGKHQIDKKYSLLHIL